MSNRYQRIDPTMLFQQKHHYQQILNARTTIKVDEPSRKSHSLFHNTRASHEKDRLRKIENKKMLLTLLEIYNNKPGILSKNFEEEKQKIDQKRRSFYSSLKKEQIDKQIRKQNRDICFNIIKAEPSVGSHKEWDQHYSHHLERERRLCNRTSNQYFDFDDVRANLNREKERRLSKQDRREQIAPSNGDKSPTILLMKNWQRKKKKFTSKAKKHHNQTIPKQEEQLPNQQNPSNPPTQK